MRPDDTDPIRYSKTTCRLEDCGADARMMSVDEYLGDMVVWCTNGHVTVHQPEWSGPVVLVYKFKRRPNDSRND